MVSFKDAFFVAELPKVENIMDGNLTQIICSCTFVVVVNLYIFGTLYGLDILVMPYKNLDATLFYCSPFPERISRSRQDLPLQKGSLAPDRISRFRMDCPL